MHEIQCTPQMYYFMSAQNVSTFSISLFNEVDDCNCVSGWVTSCVLVKRGRGKVICSVMRCSVISSGTRNRWTLFERQNWN